MLLNVICIIIMLAMSVIVVYNTIVNKVDRLINIFISICMWFVVIVILIKC